MRLKDIDETKRTHHRPWCGDDAYVLGWGVIKPQAMVGAKAALCHGDISVPQKLCRIRVFSTRYDST